MRRRNLSIAASRSASRCRADVNDRHSFADLAQATGMHGQLVYAFEGAQAVVVSRSPSLSNCVSIRLSRLYAFDV